MLHEKRVILSHLSRTIQIKPISRITQMPISISAAKLSQHPSDKTILTAERLNLLATKFPQLHDSWYFISAACFSICNKPQEISKILHFRLLQESHYDYDSTTTRFAENAIKSADYYTNADHNPEWPPQDNLSSQKLISIIDLFKESLLKSAPLGGLPKSINALTVLKNATPSNLRTTESKRSPIETLQEFNNVKYRGLQFWDTVYGKVANRIKSQMRLAYPDLIDWTLNQVYAPVLSFTDVLNEKFSSFVIIACLIPQDVNPQLKGHLRGALNNGANLEEISQVREMALLITEWCGVLLNEPAAKL